MAYLLLHIYSLIVLSVMSEGKLSKALIRKQLEQLHDSGIRFKYPNMSMHPDTPRRSRGTAIPVMTVVSIDTNQLWFSRMKDLILI